MVVVRGRMTARVEVAGTAAPRRGQAAGPGHCVVVESCGHTGLIDRFGHLSATEIGDRRDTCREEVEPSLGEQ